MKISKYQIDVLVDEVQAQYAAKEERVQATFYKKYIGYVNKETAKIVKAFERIPKRYRELAGCSYTLAALNVSGDVNVDVIRASVWKETKNICINNSTLQIPYVPSQKTIRHQIVLSSIGAENVDQLVATVCANLDKKMQ